MPRLAVVLSAALATTLLAAPGCKKAPQHTASKPAVERVGRRTPPGPVLPAPHRLSKEPDAGVFVARPSALLASVDALVPQAPPLAAVVEGVLGAQAPAELAARLAPQISGDRPWAGVHVAGEDIVVLPLKPGKADDVAAALTGLPTRGDFGAVQLPAPALDVERDQKPPAPRLAWLDKQTNNLVFADTVQGLSTSRQLASTYGGRPLWFTLASQRAAAYTPVFPYARLSVVGDGLHALDVDVLAAPGKPLPDTKDLGPGALTGMLDGPGLAVGVSTRWPGHKKAVGDIIKKMNSSVDRAGFAAKLMLDPLVDQAARTLRRWNGRVLVGAGPARHVRIGLGADDPVAAYRDLTGLLRTLIDNLSLARMFADVPGASLKKVGDTNLLTVDGVARHVPAAAKPLLDDKNRLRVAIAHNERAGGVLVVIGPDPTPILQGWVKAAAAGEPGKQSTDDLLAGALAVSPERLKPLIDTPPSQSALVGAALKLESDRAPTLLVVQKKSDRYHATVRGPDLAPRRGG